MRQGNLEGTACIHDRRKAVLLMVKMILNRIARSVPAILVLVGWLAFISGTWIENPITKIALLSLARVLP